MKYLKGFTLKSDSVDLDFLISKDVTLNEKKGEIALIILFLPSGSGNREDFIKVKFSGSAEVVGATTSGIIARDAIYDGEAMALFLFDDLVTTETFYFDNLTGISSGTSLDELNRLKGYVSQKISMEENDIFGHFGILLIDGLSKNEENFCNVLTNAIGGLPFVGGSSGDDLAFVKTLVFNGIRFVEKAASFTVVSSKVPFKLLKHQHFSFGDSDFVITEATPKDRVVHEINGELASEFYSKQIGVQIENMGPEVFSKFPFVINVNGEPFVRSIKSISKGSLEFYCAIEEGVVSSIGKRESIPDSNNRALSETNSEIDKIEFSLLFECVLRKVEICSGPLDIREEINNFYQRMSGYGFFTYGEQFNSIHINQTLTGVVFEKP